MEDSTGEIKISKKDRKHRREKNQCVDRLKEYFQIVTGIELPKGCWQQVIQLVWSKILDAGKLEKQVKVSMTLEEYAAKAGQIVKSMRTAVEKEKVKWDALESSMLPLEQQILKLHYPQQGVCSEVTHGQGSSSCQADPNDGPQEIKPKTLNGQHLMRKKHGQIALKVFFYMYTGIVLPKKWNKAKELVEIKKNDAKREGKKVKAMIRPPESAEVERTVQSSQAAFGVEKMQMNDCKNLLQLVKPMFRSQVYLDYHKQHGVSSEVVIPDKEDQALEFPYGSIQHGQSSMIYNWNDMVLGDLQDLPESGQMLESSKAIGCSNGTNSLVAPEAAVNLSSMGNFQGCRDLGDNESLVMEIKELFPQIADGGFIEVLLEMAKSIPQRLELKDSNQELESMDMRVLQLEEEVGKTCQEVGPSWQNKSKFNQHKKVQTKGKRKRSG
ncbi:PREDICTED: uncharacterized protein LOC18592560 [Theobroma cacao]|uniref:Uncharacterized protein LOC18592560 n=2 Tax=Theobroma cacao TaxID=3641 RepID=A0AB32UWB1_THECC|nr:PREDICTED: uncharacterized protein LOC18592560 [Theobroma cacao]EOY16655.1 Uncharacterized protein TCM_035475 isoform 1 [Theobroma cacao]